MVIPKGFVWVEEDQAVRRVSRNLFWLACFVMSSSARAETITVSKANEKELSAIIRQLNAKGSGVLVLEPDVAPGPLPERLGPLTRVVDRRYGGGIHYIRGNHPRIEGIWPQYSNLGTGLGKNIIISDVIRNETPIEDWKGKRKKAVQTTFKKEEDYPHSHNHYQNVLSEVWNFTNNINGVALWGDAGAFVPGGKVWGGFLSARSWPVHWDRYVPENNPPFDDKDFDAQLVGLEIDVLNAGYPEGSPPPKGSKRTLSKIGLQVVGFGKRNTAAIELRSEDTDADMPHSKRRGTFRFGVIANNALDRQSTFLLSELPEGSVGLDLGKTRYHEGAVKVRSESVDDGIVLNGGAGGKIGVSREGMLTIVAGKAGVRILGADGKTVILQTDGSGGATRGAWPGRPYEWIVFALLAIGVIALLYQNWLLRRRLGISKPGSTAQSPQLSPSVKG
jgi:hypothetical protein